MQTPLKTKGPPGPASWPVVILGGILLAVNLFVLGMAWSTVKQGRTHAEEQARINSGNLARVLERNLEGDIRAVDLALLAVKGEIARQQTTGGLRPAQLDAYIRGIFAHHPALDGIRTANAVGEIDHGIGVPQGPRTSIADRDYFLALKANPSAGLVVSKPIVSRVIHRWVIVFARRVDTADGAFGGVVYGVAPVEGFAPALTMVDPGPNGAVVLRDGDLGLIARFPYVKGISDRIGDQRLSQVAQAMRPTLQEVGTYTTRTPLDGIVRTISVRKVGSHPLWVSVGLASDDYLAQWRREARRTWTLSGLFCALTTALGVLLLRAWSRERKRRIQELSRALEEVKTLSGLLPICANCKKIRDDHGYWNRIEAYIQARSEAQFTHGICPDCAQQIYPELYEAKENAQA